MVHCSKIETYQDWDGAIKQLAAGPMLVIPAGQTRLKRLKLRELHGRFIRLNCVQDLLCNDRVGQEIQCVGRFSSWTITPMASRSIMCSSTIDDLRIETHWFSRHCPGKLQLNERGQRITATLSINL